MFHRCFLGLLFCVVATAAYAHSYEQRSEVGISWSAVSLTPPTMVNMYRSPFRARQPFVPFANAVSSSAGALVCTYNFRLGQRTRMRVGLLFSQLRALDHFYQVERSVLIDQKDIAVVAEFRLDYLQRKRVDLYGTVGIAPGLRRTHVFDFDGGPHISANHENGLWMQGHLTALGCSVGSRLRGFAELGYGYRGLVAVGASFGL